MFIEPPLEITDSLVRFRQDFPDSAQVAFIMIEYSETKPHNAITKSIKDALKAHGVIGVLAKDTMYQENLEYNILTYLYGCGLGVAVFERILNEKINPNVSLEVGYMLALNKPICYLKEQTLPGGFDESGLMPWS